MKHRKVEDRRLNRVKVAIDNRKSVGRRKTELYSLYAYRSMIVIMFFVIIAYILLVITNLK